MSVIWHFFPWLVILVVVPQLAEDGLVCYCWICSCPISLAKTLIAELCQCASQAFLPHRGSFSQVGRETAKPGPSSSLHPEMHITSEDRAVVHTVKSQVRSIGWIWSGPSEFSQTMLGHMLGIAWDRNDSQWAVCMWPTWGFFLSFFPSIPHPGWGWVAFSHPDPYYAMTIDLIARKWLLPVLFIIRHAAGVFTAFLEWSWV